MMLTFASQTSSLRQACKKGRSAVGYIPRTANQEEAMAPFCLFHIIQRKGRGGQQLYAAEASR
jgi:hypothetical protein